MKHILIVLLTVGSICTAYPQIEGQLSNEEKAEIATYMESAWNHLEGSITSLTKSQWHYKSADTVWSIAEIAEHLEKSEIELFNLVSQPNLSTKAEAMDQHEASDKTKMLMEAITSRSQKIKTRPNLEPEGKYDTPQEFLSSFKVLRQQTLDYSQQTEEALRHHFVPFGPLGDLDGYQILMFMTGHLERHRQQIEEVKENPNYPGV